MHIYFACAAALCLATAVYSRRHAAVESLNHPRLTLSGRHFQLEPHAVSEALTVRIPIDHSNTSDRGTYSNRYWINDTYYEQGGPVFFFAFGEQGVVPEYAHAFLQEGYGIQSAIMQLARKFNGLAIGWEHRFFGGSQPFPLDDQGYSRGGYAAYKYLTVDQALQDVVYFSQHFKPPGLEKHWNVLSPHQSPWIWVGGSYPGALGAWSRIRSPDVFHAVWASSAVVQNRKNGTAYYDAIYEAMAPNCTRDLHKLTNQMDDLFMHGAAQDIKAFKEAVLLTRASAPLPGQSNASSRVPGVAEVASEAEEYTWAEIGLELRIAILAEFQALGYEKSTGVFCDALETYSPQHEVYSGNNQTRRLIDVLSNPGNSTPTDEGVVTNYGLEVAQNALLYALVAAWTNFFATELNTLIPVRADAYLTGDAYNWDWLTCNELGNWQIANPTVPRNGISRAINESYWHDTVCHHLLNITEVAEQPKLQTTLKYGGWNMNPSNVFFTSGQFDPWRAFSVESTEPFAPMRNVTNTIPSCGQAPKNDEVFGVVYDGAAHAADLDKIAAKNNTPMDTGLEMFSAALQVWLPCFKPH